MTETSPRVGAGRLDTVTNVFVAQLEPMIGELECNRVLALEAIREAADAGADVIVLPELMTSGYMFSSPQEAAALAIDPEHEILCEWGEQAAAADAIVAGGFCERGEDGNTYNSAAIFDATGLRAVYRKLHLWDREKLVFTPGSAPPPVLDTRVGRVSLVICYDLEFPELTRTVALAGAQLLLVATNWPLMERPDGERPAEVVIAMATARINRIAVACADRIGTERGQPWTGGSTIVDADGWVVAESRRPGLIGAGLDLDRALDKRYTELADVFADRRPELYGAITR